MYVHVYNIMYLQVLHIFYVHTIIQSCTHNVHVHTCTCTCICTCIYIYTYIRTYMLTYTLIHTCTSSLLLFSCHHLSCKDEDQFSIIVILVCIYE